MSIELCLAKVDYVSVFLDHFSQSKNQGFNYFPYSRWFRRFQIPISSNP